MPPPSPPQVIKHTCPIPGFVMSACGGVFPFFHACRHLFQQDKRLNTFAVRPQWRRELELERGEGGGGGEGWPPAGPSAGLRRTSRGRV